MDHDPVEIQKIVLPLMNVSRRMYNGQVNPKEPNGQTIYVTSASSKISYAYEKLIEILQSSILDPENYIAMGCNYKVPLAYGLLNKDFVEEQRLSPTYSEEAFANEYLSLFSAVSEDSWFNLAAMDRYRKIKNPEKKYRSNPSAPNAFYLLSIDVGRLHDSTVCCVFKVFPREQYYAAKLVNIIHIGLSSKTFHSQVIEIKRLIRDYKPREVVIDINGLIPSPFKTFLIAGNPLELNKLQRSA